MSVRSTTLHGPQRQVGLGEPAGLVWMGTVRGDFGIVPRRAMNPLPSDVSAVA
jgi:hypothetical protein